MKRDMNLVRKILFQMEEDKMLSYSEGIIKINGYSREQILYHMRIMAQADLLHVEKKKSPKKKTVKSKFPEVVVSTDDLHYYSLSWEGHEFLDAARDDKRWEKAKEAMEQAGGFALDIMKQLLVQYLKTELKLS